MIKCINHWIIQDFVDAFINFLQTKDFDKKIFNASEIQ